MLHPLAITVFLLSSALAADSKAPRIEAHLHSGRTDKAWAICEKLLAEEALHEAAEREVCAEAHWQRITERSTDVPLAALESHYGNWPDTKAGRHSHALAARRHLESAQGDPSALEALARDYSGTLAAEEAMASLWELAVGEGTSAAVRRFMEAYPEAPQLSEARVHHHHFLWKETEAIGTAAAWRAFCELWPDHPRVDEARQWELTLAYREAEAADRERSWATFLDAYPTHPRHEEAEQRWLEVVFREAATRGPRAIVAAAEAHPEYPRAALLRAEALRSLVEVHLFSGSPTDPGRTVPRGAGSPELTTPESVLAVAIHRPPGEEPVRADLTMVRDGHYYPLVEGYAAVLGVSRTEAAAMGGVTWSKDDGGLNGSLTTPLCQPDGADTWFAVVVHLGDEELVFPFRLSVPCR